MAGQFTTNRLSAGELPFSSLTTDCAEHLTHRCSGWTEDLHRHRGWAPEVA